jgi:uncharacterized damage-inducible protein DinB
MTPVSQPTSELVAALLMSREFFERSTRVLSEDDSNFRPTPEMMTVAQQVAHTAMTIDWFIQGAARPEGFDLDFEAHGRALEAVTSLEAARAMLAKSYETAIEYLGGLSDEDAMRPLPPGPVMGGMPLKSIVPALVEHTAHHRGALTVYSRLRGKVPAMPYGDM